jgi:2-polyprenyl-3-methyl-5-hydroxy-6-metoxy-1,4-benzoquinol methylase
MANYTNKLNKGIIHDFWKARSQASTIRWTSKELLTFEIDYLNERLKSLNERIRILDLGCGHGELSRLITKKGDSLSGVDFIPEFSKSFKETDNHSFTCVNVADFVTDQEFDLVLLMGVVQFLEVEEELRVYDNMSRMLSTNGIAVIKSQVGIEDEVLINEYSDALKAEYSSRYPHVTQQSNSILKFLNIIEIIEYPSRFNHFSNSKHVAFICEKKGK